jgi:hypothetical protein
VALSVKLLLVSADGGLMRVARSADAGQYAEARFRLLRRPYRQRVLPRAAVLLIPLTFAGATLSAIGHGTVLWLGGTLLGGSLVMWLYVADSVPAHIERWGIGAAGERRTERVLRPLQRVGWTIRHDLDLPGAGNIDHLAVGPAGVFVLDSKAWSGIVTVDQDGATITARDAPDSAWLARGEHRAATRTAARTARALAVAVGRTVPAAQSVIVVWGAFPQRVAVSGGVTYVAGEHVHDWLIGQRACLNRTELAALSAANTPGLFGSESSHLL